MQRLLMMAMVGLAACTQFPELDRATSPDVDTAEYPELEDPDILLLQAEGGSTSADLEAELLSRADALRSRSAAIDGAGVDEATRQRMAAGQDRLAAERARLGEN